MVVDVMGEPLSPVSWTRHLQDVGATAPAEGQTLVYDGARYQPANPPSSQATGHAQFVGDGSSQSFTVTHGLGTTDLIVQMYDHGVSPIEQVQVSKLEILNADQIEVDPTGGTPSTDQYRVVILALAPTAAGIGVDGGTASTSVWAAEWDGGTATTTAWAQQADGGSA